MAKRKKKTEEPLPEGDSCAALVPRIQRLEQAFKDLSGMTVNQYQESEADNPVVETKEFDSSVIRTHKDGKLEFLKKCPFCGNPVSDLASHKAHCSKRPAF